MGMTVGGSDGHVVPYINMTPLIDVLLVLLIIFMVITPITPKGLEALVPQPNEDEQQQEQRAAEVKRTFQRVPSVLSQTAGTPKRRYRASASTVAQLTST